MQTDIMDYTCGGDAFEGFCARPDGPGPHPAVLVCHAWKGQLEEDHQKACRLAEMGYVGFCADVYGTGCRAADNDEAAALMTPLAEDWGGVLKDRLHASVETMRGLPDVDGSRMASIGYCFGGLCALGLARSGADLRGVVSFHGLLTGHEFGAGSISSRILVLHGYDDPMAPPENLLEFAADMTSRGVDWQVHAYGGTMHAFTVPEANDPDFGTVYNPDADRRSWESASNFLAEVLAG